MPRQGYRINLQAIRVRESGQRRIPWTPIICALGIIAVVMVWLPSIAHSAAPAPATPVNHPVAHVQPAPASTVATVRVSGNTGAICILPAGTAKPRAVELVKVP
jgi:hypothetical protein